MLVQKPPVIKQVNVKELVLDSRVQMRATINRNAVVEYAEAMEDGDEFPPIVVFHRAGGPKIVADGYHRVLAARKIKVKTIAAEVRDGGRREATIFAAGANSRHGVRRTNEDKRRAVLALLSDKEWQQWSDMEIARACGVGGAMVNRYRGYLGGDAQPPPDADGNTRRKFMRGGKVQEMVVPSVADKMDRIHSGEMCPYCGQKMPGASHRIR